MLTVGTDTYATLAEATAYIESYYLCSESKRATWEALNENAQEIYLRRSAQEIDRCQFQGIKAATDQTMEFPRYVYRDPAGYYYEYDYTTETAVVPENVKRAQVEEALELASPSNDTTEKNIRVGSVKSYKIGNLSETYGNDSTIAKQPAEYVINSKTAAKLLAQYTNGSFRIS